MEKHFPFTHGALRGTFLSVYLVWVLLLGQAIAPHKAQASATNLWVNIGPSPILVNGAAAVSGRVPAIAVDPSSSNHWLIGAADGGVWQTLDAGVNWVPLTDDQATLATGAIAFAPSNPNIIYVGTGFPLLSVATFAGAGLLKSTNGGTAWQLMATSNFAGAAFSAIIVHPTNPAVLLATTAQSGVGIDPLLKPLTVPPRGIFKSTNGGVSWSQKGPVVSTSNAGDGTALTANPTNFNQMYAGIGVSFVAQTNGVYRSTDTGETWGQIIGPWSTMTGGVGRVAVAIAPSNPNVVYVSVQDAFNGIGHDGGLLGLWRTDNAWAGTPTWAQVPTAATDGTLPGYGYCGNACWARLGITVDPSNPDILYALGITFWKCTNCGTNPTWTDVRDGDHIDQFSVAWTGNRLILGNDGGVYSTTNGGASWFNHNTNLSITQFYAGCPHPTNANFALGGTQDNGSIKWSGSNTWQWFGVAGDTGPCAISSSHPDIDWAFYTLRTTNGGATLDQAASGIDFSQAKVFIAPCEKCPSRDDVFITGTSTLLKSTNYFSGTNTSWFTNSPTQDEPISALTFAPSDTNCNTYAFGTQFGNHLLLTSNGGTTWANLDLSNAVPNRYVTDLAFNPTNANILYVTLSGFDENTPAQPGHVFQTTNAFGVSPTWLNVSPPADIPHNTVVLDPSNPNNIYIGTDIGIWRSSNGGASWSHMGPESGMPNVAVFDLEISRGTGRLMAFTHGRGAFVLVSAPTFLPPSLTRTNLTLSFRTLQGLSYYIEYKDALNAASWQPLQTISGDGSLKSSTNSILLSSQRFYRLRVQLAQ
ncbi:MAG: hypothetical protein C5B50_07100 [Verrucomicrobia bacterium]|nr:MAG: hypothetical protein C5B50_07100 [Verrucomicrobiota bacterium]